MLSRSREKRGGGEGWLEKDRRGAPEHVPPNAQVGVGVRSARLPSERTHVLDCYPGYGRRSRQLETFGVWSQTPRKAQRLGDGYPTYAADQHQSNLDSRRVDC